MLHCRFQTTLNLIFQSCKHRRIAIALTELDDDGTLIYLNSEFARLTGLPTSGTQLYPSVRETLFGTTDEPWKEAQPDDPAEVFAAQCRDIDGNTIPALCYFRPLMLPTGSVAGLMTIGRFNGSFPEECAPAWATRQKSFEPAFQDLVKESHAKIRRAKQMAGDALFLEISLTMKMADLGPTQVLPRPPSQLGS